MPGFGRSDKYSGDYSTGALADRLFRLLDQKKIEEADLVAHSWGSSIALAMALQHPRRVRTLTLMGAWVYEEQQPPFITWSRAPVVGEILYALFYRSGSTIAWRSPSTIRSRSSTQGHRDAAPRPQPARRGGGSAGGCTRAASWRAAEALRRSEAAGAADLGRPGSRRPARLRAAPAKRAPRCPPGGDPAVRAHPHVRAAKAGAAGHACVLAAGPDGPNPWPTPGTKRAPPSSSPGGWGSEGQP